MDFLKINLTKISGHNAPVGSLLISPNQIEARIWKSFKSSYPASSITIIGRYIRKTNLNGISRQTTFYKNDIYDRQILAFGSNGQKIISKAKVDIAAKHMKRINPRINILSMKDSVVKDTASKALLDRDVIFCCTDEL
jgi:molybdopterin/thiamine biosynthesis adenylyltransferase